MKIKSIYILIPFILALMVGLVWVSVALTAPEAAGLWITRLTPTGGASHPFDVLEIHFSAAVMTGTFTINDVAFSGPSGVITPTAVTRLAADQYQLVFAGLTGLDPYALIVGPDIRDLANHAMDQNHNGIYGEPQDAYRAALFSAGVTIAGGDATFDSKNIVVYGDSAIINGSHPFASLAVLGGALLTHSPATTIAEYRLELTITDTVWVDTGASIDISSRGYLPGYTLGNTTVGGATAYAGGSFGGLGNPWGPGVPNWVYGDYRNPNEPGSGGGNNGSGGGLVRITAGAAVIDGALLADGSDGGCNLSGGSGGGIRLEVGSLAGGGVIQATGGDSSGACNGGAGGGGRVAVYYTTLDGFDPTAQVSAHGGEKLSGPVEASGAVGTVYLKELGGEGQLRLDSHGALTSAWTPLGMSSESVFSVDHLVITGTNVIAAPEHEMPFEANNVSIFSGGNLTHRVTTASDAYSLRVTIADTLWISTTGMIDVSRRGYLPGYTLGITTTGGATAYAGGSYGGLGSPYGPGATNWVYGDYRDPNELGSGGGNNGSGGGLVRITAGSAMIDGALLTDGGDGGCNLSGGSGGGIRLEVGSLAGGGVIQANGGDSSGACFGGAGGGGRVALYYTTLSGFNPAEQVSAHGGEKLSGPAEVSGAVGTVYLKELGGEGQLRLDSHGALTSAWTPLGMSSESAFSVDALVITGTNVIAAPEHEMPLEANKISIFNGGNLTHRVTTTSQAYALRVTIADTLWISTTGMIDVSSRGYLPGYTLGMTMVGGATVYAGGSYGGLGSPYGLGTPNWVYGDYRDPNELGSGGGNNGSGGGLVRISAGSAMIDGALLADGGDGGCNAAGGSGGGIRLEVGSLAGGGVIQAIGGDSSGACVGGAGGGGRVAVYYTTLDGFDPTAQVSAHGGEKLSGPAEASGAVGTVYLKELGGEGQLRLDSHGALTSAWTPLGMSSESVFSVDHLVITGTNVVAAPEHEMPLEANNISIFSGGNLTHRVTTTSQAYALRVTIADTLEIGMGGWIDVSSRGYLPGYTLGMTMVGGATVYAGGSYGGLGSPYGPGMPNWVYGDYRDPNELGSGGGNNGSGGGLVRITAGSAVIDGALLADGGDGGCNLSGGSGGGIRLVVQTLSGSGSIHANGGISSGACVGGAGGGGRVAVYYTTLSGFNPARQVSAHGGEKLSGPAEASGAVGTVYQKELGGEGQLRLDSHGALTSAWTPLGMGSESAFIVDHMVITGTNVVASPEHEMPIEANNLSIFNGGNLTHRPTTASQEYSLRMTITDSLLISTTGMIDVSARGYLPGYTLGNTTLDGATSYGGGSYGGLGSVWGPGASNDIYGDYRNPNELGSGGGNNGSGGGLVRITARNAVIEGALLANGGEADCNAAGGSGGGILLNVDRLSGSGIVHANGGNTTHACFGGSGGGGRVAIYYRHSLTLPVANILASGGTSLYQPGQDGSLQITDTPTFWWSDPANNLFHDTETLSWQAYAVDPAATTADIAVYGPSQPLALGTGLPVMASFAWNTNQVADGRYEIRASFYTDGQYIGQASRNVLVNNSVAWHSGLITANETWSSGQVHVVEADLFVSSGATLTIEAGAIVKFAPGVKVTVLSSGILNAPATIEAPIVLTSLADDTIGGDTNLDGALTMPFPGEWAGIALQGTGQANLNEHVDIRYTSTQHSGVLSGSETWIGNNVHTINGDVLIPNGVTLTIQAGAVVKFNLHLLLSVQAGGHLIVQGNVAEPVTFTSIQDDSVGGDTNGDGSQSTPAPGDWIGLQISGEASLNHVVMTYGAGSVSGGYEWPISAFLVANSGSSVTLANSSLSDGQFDGIIDLSGVQMANSLIVRTDRGINLNSVTSLVNATLDANRIGIWCHGGTAQINNTIISNSFDFGITGDCITIRYSNVWSTTGQNYGGANQTGQNGNVSVDPQFKDAERGNYQLAYLSPMIDAADGGAAPVTDYMGAPRYDDPRTPNTGLPTAGGEYADMGAYEFVEDAESPIDLVADHVTGPAQGLAGEMVTVTWEVRNIGLITGTIEGFLPGTENLTGTLVAVGPWHDQLSLVAEVPTRGVVEIPVAEVLSEATLGPGQSAVFTASVRIPGGTEGGWRWKVTTNVRGEVFEGRNWNNNSSSLDSAMQLNVPELNPGTPVTGYFLDIGQAAWFKLTQPAGQEIIATLDLQAANGRTRLYAGYGSMPTMQDYDRSSQNWNTPDARLALPAPAVTQTVYLLVVPEMLTGSNQPFSLSAGYAAFDFASLGLQQAGNAGPVTVPLFGSGFTTGLAARLQLGTTVLTATQVLVQDSGTALATFDLTGAAEGLYDVVISQEGQERSLLSIFAVVAGSGGRFEARPIVPQNVRDGRVFQGQIEYENVGDADIPVPLVILQSSSQNPVWLDADWFGGSVLQILAVPTEGLFGGVLRPGEPYSVRFSSRVGGAPVTYSVAWIDGNSTTPMDWEALGNAVLDGASPVRVQAWNALVSTIGNTTGDYVRALTQAVEEARGYGVNLPTVRSVLMYLIEREIVRLPEASVTGTLYAEGLDHTLGRKTVLLTEQTTGQVYVTQAWYDGTFAFRSVPVGTYDLSVQDYLPDPWGQVTVSAPVSGLQVIVQPGAILSGLVLSPGGIPVPGASVSARLAVSNTLVTIMTDMGGVYTLRGLPDGDYQIWVGADGFVSPDIVTLSIHAGQPNGASLQLLEGGSVTGQVLNPSGQPVAYARVVASPVGVNAGAGKEAFTAPDGSFEIQGLATGSYNVAAAADGYGAGQTSSVAVEGRAVTSGVTVSLTGAASINGTVNRAAGSPLAGVAIASDVLRPDSDPVVTGAAGTFTISDLPAGEHHLWASADGYLTQKITVTLTAGQTLPLVVELRPAGRINGVAQLTDGSPLVNVPVTLLGPFDAAQIDTTDAAGGFGFANLPDGPYVLAVGEAEGGLTVGRQTYTLDASHNLYTTTLSLNLAWLNGQVLDAEGAPVEKALIGLVKDGELKTTATTDATGRYRFLVLEASMLDVVAADEQTGILRINAISVTPGSTVTVPDLVGGSVPLTVTVQANAPGSPAVAQASVVLKKSWGETFKGAMLGGYTDENGQYVFKALQPGTYEVLVQAEGLAPELRIVTVGAPGAAEAFVLESGRVLIGMVVDTAGKPVEGARVFALDQATGRSYLGLTDAYGAYAIDFLPSGVFDVWFTDGGYRYAVTPDVSLGGSGTAIANATLAMEGCWVQGQALNDLADPIFGAAVQVMVNGQVPLTAAMTDGSGSFELGPLPEGLTTFTVAGQGFGIVTQSITVTNGVTITFQLGTQTAIGVNSPMQILGYREVTVNPDGVAGVDYTIWEWQEWLTQMPPAPERSNIDTDDWRHSWSKYNLPDCCPELLDAYLQARDKAYASDALLGKLYANWNFNYQKLDQMNTTAVNAAAAMTFEILAKTAKMVTATDKWMAEKYPGNTITDQGLVPPVFSTGNALSIGTNLKNLAMAVYNGYKTGNFKAGSVALDQFVAWTTMALDAGKISPDAQTYLGGLYDIGKELIQLKKNLNEDLSVEANALASYAQGRDWYYDTLKQHQKNILALKAIVDSCATPTPTPTGTPPTPTATTTPPTRTPRPTPHSTGTPPPCANPPCTTPPPPTPPFPTLGPTREATDRHGGDPNEKVSIGVGTQGFVRPGTTLLYTIYFENVPSANAPAQDVRITDQLSDKLDWSSLELVSIGFNNVFLNLAPGLNQYATTAYVPTDPNPVQVRASLDPNTGILSWRMTSVDLVTGGLPEDPLAGFLPPNDVQHQGEGFVTFQVRPLGTLAEGAVIQNLATIVFDVNPAIDTNTVVNTIDASAPTSQVSPLMATSPATFMLSWTGSDGNGSGVASYDLYVAVDGGPFVLWRAGLTTTQADFTGQIDHVYSFYSVATDQVGNREATPGTADAATRLLSVIYLPLVDRGY